jgi:hypothetical protein
MNNVVFSIGIKFIIVTYNRQGSIVMHWKHFLFRATFCIVGVQKVVRN